MSYGTEKERQQLKAAYPGSKWAEKVNNMDDRQVIAVLRSLQTQNKIK